MAISTTLILICIGAAVLYWLYKRKSSESYAAIPDDLAGAVPD